MRIDGLQSNYGRKFIKMRNKIKMATKTKYVIYIFFIYIKKGYSKERTKIGMAF